MHGEQRAERVAVGVLVGGQQEAIAGPKLPDHVGQCRIALGVAGQQLGGVAHGSSSRETRAPRSMLSS